MPPYTVDLLPGEPIILEVIGKDFQADKHIMGLIGEVNRRLDDASGPMAYIIDVREASLGLDDIIAAANAGTRMTGLMKHPRLRKTIVVTGSRLIELAARGVNSPVFGHIKMEVSKTLEEALEMARQ